MNAEPQRGSIAQGDGGTGGTREAARSAGSADSEAGRRTASVGDSSGCGPPGSTGEPTGAQPYLGPYLFQLQLRIPSWTRRAYGVRTGTEIRSSGGARDRGRSRFGEIFRSSQS